MSKKILREIVGRQPLFFKPDIKFVKWLAKYANGRIIIDVGCGEVFTLTKQLFSVGYKKIVAIDPQLDINDFMNWKMSMVNHDFSIHGLNKRIEDLTVMYNGTMTHQEVLLVFARPCHSDFVENALKLKGDNVEALYITVPENIEKYCDLGKFDDRKVLLKHEGSSADKEVVYSIK